MKKKIPVINIFFFVYEEYTGSYYDPENATKWCLKQDLF